MEEQGKKCAERVVVVVVVANIARVLGHVAPLQASHVHAALRLQEKATTLEEDIYFSKRMYRQVRVFRQPPKRDCDVDKVLQEPAFTRVRQPTWRRDLAHS